MDSIHPPLPGTLFTVVPEFKTSQSSVSALNHLTPPLISECLGSEDWSSGVRDAVLDLVYPQLGAWRVWGAKVVDSLAGLQLQRVSDSRNVDQRDETDTNVQQSKTTDHVSVLDWQKGSSLTHTRCVLAHTQLRLSAPLVLPLWLCQSFWHFYIGVIIFNLLPSLCWSGSRHVYEVKSMLKC